MGSPEQIVSLYKMHLMGLYRSVLTQISTRLQHVKIVSSRVSDDLRCWSKNCGSS